jgi:hypothetical protein
MKQLEEIFRSSILVMLKRKGKIVDDLIGKLMNWRATAVLVFMQETASPGMTRPLRQRWHNTSCATPLPRKRSVT